ncbi:MAG: phosphatase PAP2 family protein [Flavobacteriaceae bacterium]
MEQLIQFDKDLFLFLNGLGTPLFDWFWLFITGKWNAIPMYAVLLFLLYKKFGIQRTILIVTLVAVMIACTDQLANLFKKVLFLRPRPCHDDTVSELMRLVKSRCGGKYGYFSAHAASSMALAVFLGSILKSKIKYLFTFLLIWALCVGYSRIYIGVHYPGDVVTGVFFGVIIAKITLVLEQKIRIKFLEKPD